MAGFIGIGNPGIDYNLISSLGPSYLQGQMMRQKLEEMENERREREYMAALLTRKMEFEQKKFEAEQQKTEFDLQNRKRFADLAGGLLSEGLGPSPSPVAPAGPPPGIAPPPPPQRALAPEPEPLLQIPSRPPVPEPSPAPLRAPQPQVQVLPPDEGKQEDWEDPLTRNMNQFMRDPRKLLMIAQAAALSGQKDPADIYKSLYIDEIKRRQDLVKQGIDYINRPDADPKIARATFPFFQGLPDSFIKKASGYKVDTVQTPNGPVVTLSGGGFSGPQIIPDKKSEQDKQDPFNLAVKRYKEEHDGQEPPESWVQQWHRENKPVTNINLGQGKADEIGFRAIMDSVEKGAQPALQSAQAITRIKKMKSLLEEGAGGIWGQYTAKLAPYAEALGLGSDAMSKARVYEALADALGGSMRMQLGLVGPMSNQDMARLDRVKGGGQMGLQAAKELLTEYESLGMMNVRQWNSLRDAAAETSPMVGKAFRRIEIQEGRAPSPGASSKKAKPTLEEFLKKNRPANPGVSDQELTNFYYQKYGR